MPEVAMPNTNTEAEAAQLPAVLVVPPRTVAFLILLAALFWLAICAPTPLLAQSTEDSLAGREAAIRDQEGGSEFRGSIGVGIGYVPDFEGGDSYDLRPLPILDLRYGRFFLSTAQGLGYNVIQTPSWTVAPSVNYVFGRDESDSPLLRGLGDVEGGVSVGGIVGFSYDRLSLVMDVDVGVGDLEGATVGLGAFYSLPIGDLLSARLGLGTQYADSDYNQARFGVTREQAALSGYDPYEPSAGFKHFSLSGSLTYDLTERINLGFFGEWRLLTGPAADSPLVKAGSDNQLRTGLTVGYQLR
jgi:outer membrane scaffolding protein for murein synthesis (MipA/OmpV family)